MKSRSCGLLVFAAFVFFGSAHGQTTSVTVRDRAGHPVAEAEVEILAGEEVVAVTAGGKEGTAAFALEVGSYRARATAPGFVVGLSRPFTASIETASTIEVALR